MKTPEDIRAAADRLQRVVDYIGTERGMQDVIMDGQDADDLRIVIAAARTHSD